MRASQYQRIGLSVKTHIGAILFQFSTETMISSLHQH